MIYNEGETPATSSTATAQAATSSNRPIVMPEAFSAGLMAFTFRRLRRDKRVERRA